MALDPAADIGRRVWKPCSYCPNEDGLFMLEAQTNLVRVQCGLCYESWWLDTGQGVGRRPGNADGLPQWPS